MHIKLRSIRIENFKGIKERVIHFGDRTAINGANATGKTTVFDAFTWLLFNKNSAGEEKFNVRPLDAEGKRVDNVEIKVLAILDVDGREVTLSKVQKQNWIKKRGTNKVELQGNVNSFEIDGYPKSEAEYRAYISGLVAEDLFKMLTGPQYFVSRPWKEQRDILMGFVSDVSDVELAKRDPEFADLLPELERAPSTDDIQKKFSKALSEWKKKQAEIPVRIDELSKALVEIDVAELEIARAELERQIAECDQKIEDAGNAVGDLMTEEMQLQMDLSGIMQTMNSELAGKRRELQDRSRDCGFDLNDIKNHIVSLEKQITGNKEEIASLEAKKPGIRQKWQENAAKVFDETPYLFDESKWVFDESSTVCSMCGQTLPGEIISNLRTDFEEKMAREKAVCAIKLQQARNLFLDEKEHTQKDLTEQADLIKRRISELTAENEDLQKQVTELQDQERQAEVRKTELEKLLAELPAEADYSQNAEYVKLKSRHDEVKEWIEVMKSSADAAEAFKAEKAFLQNQLDVVKAEIAKTAKNVEIEERIGDLETEQREVGQKVADQEKMLYLLEQFIRAKMMKIADSVNAHFRTVSWKLFETQLNGGLKECCECAVNGVPFSALNSGHRIVAGLDIINSLSELYGVMAPIFIDNAESVNEFNLPGMDTQLILLTVTGDKELVVKKCEEPVNIGESEGN